MNNKSMQSTDSISMFDTEANNQQLVDDLLPEVMLQHDLTYEVAQELILEALVVLPDRLQTFENYLIDKGYSESDIDLMKQIEEEKEYWYSVDASQE